MPDYNAAVASGINTTGPDISGTLNTLQNLQRTQAQTGLLQLQQLQQQRQYNALQAAAQAYRSGQDGTGAYLGAGGDPAGAGQLQNLYAGQRAMAVTPGGLQPQAYESLTGAAKNNQETSNLGVTHQNLLIEQGQKDMAYRGGVAQSILQDPSDDNWSTQTAALKGHISPQGQAQIDAAKTPEQRQAVAKSMLAAAVPTSDYTAPVTQEQGNKIFTRGQVMSGATNTPPAPGQVSPTPLTPAIGALSPRDMSAQRGAGEQDAKYTDATTTAAQTARTVNYTLGNIAADAEKLPVGRGMAAASEGRAWLQSVYDNVPGAHQVMSDPGTDATAAYDSLLKNSGQLTRQALMQTHERAAVAYDMIQKQLPSVETSRAGLKNVVAQWQGLNDDAVEKQQVMANRPVAGRSDQFESEWNKNVNPVAFMLNRMDKGTRSQVIQGLSQSDQGRQTLADVKRTFEYLKANQ